MTHRTLHFEGHNARATAVAVNGNHKRIENTSSRRRHRS